jgi:phospholipase/lecithinase/hemolysin
MHRFILLFLLWVPLTVSAATYSSLYVFGDSLSDPANLYSNGPVAAQYLSPLLGVPLDNSKNYAFSGATTSQVLGQVNHYLSGHSADPSALYMVWAGPNDIASSPSPFMFDPTMAIYNLSSTIGSLAASGAQQFFVPNMPDLGRTPALAGTPFSLSMTQVSLNYNQHLEDALQQLRVSLGVDIVSYDTYGLLNAVIANPGQYGFSNVSERCIASAVCRANADVANSYLFWDEVHPTTHGHQVLAASMATVIVPVPATLPLLVSALAVLVGFRRRQ